MSRALIIARVPSQAMSPAPATIAARENPHSSLGSVTPRHPDANKHDSQAASRFAELNAAYEIVGDEAKRKAYEAMRARYQVVTPEATKDQAK